MKKPIKKYFQNCTFIVTLKNELHTASYHKFNTFSYSPECFNIWLDSKISEFRKEDWIDCIVIFSTVISSK